MRGGGFVLTLDAMLAAAVVLTMLAFANYQINRSEVTQWSEAGMLAAGYDAVTVLYNSGDLQSMNASAMEAALSPALQPNYKMRLEVRGYRNISGQFIQSSSAVVGPEAAESAVRAHGRRAFMTFAGDDADTYNIAEFWIWLR